MAEEELGEGAKIAAKLDRWEWHQLGQFFSFEQVELVEDQSVSREVVRRAAERIEVFKEVDINPQAASRIIRKAQNTGVFDAIVDALKDFKGAEDNVIEIVSLVAYSETAEQAKASLDRIQRARSEIVNAKLELEQIYKELLPSSKIFSKSTTVADASSEEPSSTTEAGQAVRFAISGKAAGATPPSRS